MKGWLRLVSTRESLVFSNRADLELLHVKKPDSWKILYIYEVFVEPQTTPDSSDTQGKGLKAQEKNSTLILIYFKV